MSRARVAVAASEVVARMLLILEPAALLIRTVWLAKMKEPGPHRLFNWEFS